MMSDVIITEAAEQDYESAFRWYWQHSPNAALGFMMRLQECFLRIATNPNSHPRFLDDYRFQILKVYPYIVVFEIRVGAPWVLAVGHTRRSKRYWKRRLK